MQLRVYLPLEVFTLLSTNTPPSSPPATQTTHNTSTSSTTSSSQDQETELEDDAFSHNLDALLRRSSFQSTSSESTELDDDDYLDYDTDVVDLEAVKEALRRAELECQN